MITPRTEPQYFNPVFNDIFFVLESSNSTEQEFKLSTDVEVFNEDTSSWELAGSLKSFPNPNNGLLFINVHKILESYINADVFPELSDVKHSERQFKQYRISSVEKYKKTWEITDSETTVFIGNDVTKLILNKSADEELDELVSKIIIDTDGAYPSYDGLWNVLVVSGNEVTINRVWDTTVADSGTVIQEGNPFYEGEPYDSDELFAHNSVITRRLWLDWENEISFYKNITNFDTRRFLTTAPENFTITRTHQAHYTLVDNPVDTPSYTGQTFEGFRLITNKGSFDNLNFDSGTTNQDIFKILPTGYKNLEDIPSGDWTVASGSLPVFDENTTKYTIRLIFKRAGSSYFGNSVTFKIDDECSLYKRYELLFVDKLGALNSFTFHFSYSETIRTDREFYNKYLLDYNTSEDKFDFNTDEAGKTQIDNIVTKRLTLNSRWITDNDNEYFKELFNSPFLLLYDTEQDQYHRVNIIDSSHTEKYQLKDKLWSYNITVEYAIKEPQMK